MLSLGGSVPDVADGLLRHRLLNGLVIGMPSDHGHAMLWAPVSASNTRGNHVCVRIRVTHPTGNAAHTVGCAWR
jgi:hypothetical protein